MIDLDKVHRLRDLRARLPRQCDQDHEQAALFTDVAAGDLGWIVKIDAHVIELVVTTFLAGPKRLKKFGQRQDMDRHVVRFSLRYENSPITQYYED
jgi:hypothetical protein